MMKTLVGTEKIGFGKHKGMVVNNLPESYKNWLIQALGYNIVKGSPSTSNFTSYITADLIKHVRECKSREVNKNLPLTEMEQRLVEQSRSDNEHRRICQQVGRDLIYFDIQIPFD